MSTAWSPQRRWWTGCGVVCALFVVSRALFHHAGIRFDASPLSWYWQYLDPELLRHDLLESVWYQHFQPPLFNLYLGVLLKLAGDAFPAWAWTTYLGMGLVLHLGMYGLLARLGLPVPAAVAATAIFLCSPASILYENWLFYTYPVAALLVVVALGAHRLLARPTVWNAALVAGAMATAVLTRSALHTAWYVALALLLLALLRFHERARLPFLAFLLLVLLFQVKNQLLFGTPSLSTWFGMNAAKIATWPAPAPVKRALVARGEVSPLVFIYPFSPLDRYPPALRRQGLEELPAAVPALTAERRSTGATNYNNIAYIPIARAYLGDALVMLRERPDVYRSMVGLAWLLSFQSPTQTWALDGNRARIAAWDRLYDGTLYGAPGAFRTAAAGARDDPLRHLVLHVEVGWVLLLGVGLAFGLVAGLRATAGGRGDVAVGGTLLLMALTVGYLLVVGNLLELGENNRFRMMSDPLVFVLAAAALDRALRGAARRLGRRGPPPRRGAPT